MTRWFMVPVTLALVTTGCEQDLNPGDLSLDAITGWIVAVSLDQETVDVDTAELEGAAPSLADVVGKAYPNEDISTLTADFVAHDGFRPVDSPNCQEMIPVAGALLEKCVIDKATGNLTWSVELGMPGCLGVRGLTVLTLSRVN